MKILVCVTALVALAVLALLPIGAAIQRSLLVDGGWSLDYYRDAFDQILTTGSYQRELLGNTLALGGCATLLALLLGLPYAFFTARTDLPGRGLFVALYLLPIIVPPLISAIAWTQLTTWIYEWRGWSIQDGFPFSGLAGSAVVFALAYLPFVILFTRRALARIPASVEEAGLLSAGRWRTLTRIVLPLSLSGILAGAVFVFIFTICDFGVVDYLNTLSSSYGRAYGAFAVYPIAAFSKWALGSTAQTGPATAEGMPLAILALLALILAFALRRRGDGAIVGTSWRPAPVIRLGGWKLLALPFCAFVLFVSFALPVGVLVIQAGSIETFRAALVNQKYEIVSTVVHAFLAASLGAMLAFLLAWMSVRARPLVGHTLEILAYLPLVFPPLLLGFGLLVAWNSVDPIRVGLFFRDDKIFVPLVLMALVAKYLPFSFAAILAHLRTLERSQEEAAAVAGVPWGKRVWGVLVPSVRPGIVTGWILAFVFCLREIDTLTFLTPSESVMYRIYSMVHVARDDQVAALSVILIGLLGLPFLIYGLIAWRRLRVV